MELQYVFYYQDSFHHFHFHSFIHYSHVIPLLLTGVIRTTEELDRESTPHYWLTIYAQDHGAIPLHSVVQVFIEVLDINDNAPLPTQPVFRAEVPENSPMGVYVLTVEAVDPDTSSSGNLTYRLKTNSAKKYFTIDERTGETNVLITFSHRIYM